MIEATAIALDALLREGGEDSLTECKFTGGEFVGNGAGCYRHFAEFSTPMTLRFEKAGEVKVELQVRALGASGHQMQMH